MSNKKGSFKKIAKKTRTFKKASVLKAKIFAKSRKKKEELTLDLLTKLLKEEHFNQAIED